MIPFIVHSFGFFNKVVLVNPHPEHLLSFIKCDALNRCFNQRLYLLLASAKIQRFLYP